MVAGIVERPHEVETPATLGDSRKLFEEFGGEQPHPAAAHDLIEDADANDFTF